MILKIIAIFIILIHGLIHLMGFVKAWNLAEVKNLTGKTIIALSPIATKVVGVIWLLAFLMFLISAASLLANHDWWWMVAAIGILLSQILIIIYWKDAWAGSIANLIILIIVISSFAYSNFKSKITSDMQVLFSEANRDNVTVTEEMLAGLPSPVQRNLRYSGVVGKPIVNTVRLKQTGKIRMGPQEPWRNLTAEEVYTTDPPGFIWRGEMEIMGLPIVQVKDSYVKGNGSMLVKILSLFPIADARGEEMDQGAMMRYLNEMMWFPSSYLGKNVTWKVIDDNSAEVTLTHLGKSVSAKVIFDAEGRITNFIAQRYRTAGKELILDTWSTPITKYGEYEGLRLPVAGQGVWNLKDGDFAYIEIENIKLEYDQAKSF